MNVLNDFLDILQNIEAEIIATYKAHPEISDKDVLLATERLIGSYTRERKNYRHCLFLCLKTACLCTKP